MTSPPGSSRLAIASLLQLNVQMQVISLTAGLEESRPRPHYLN